MPYKRKHICAGVSYGNVGSDLCYELSSEETIPKDVREFLHDNLDEYLDQSVEIQQRGLFFVGELPIDDADDTKYALKEAKEQLAHYIHVSGKVIRDLEAQVKRLSEKASIPTDVAIKRSKS